MAMKTAGEKNIFKGIKIPGKDIKISHMFYADDVLFVGEWCISNMNNLAQILQFFHIASGLKVNFNKSKVFGVGVSSSETSSGDKLLRCEASVL